MDQLNKMTIQKKRKDELQKKYDANLLTGDEKAEYDKLMADLAEMEKLLAQLKAKKETFGENETGLDLAAEIGPLEERVKFLEGVASEVLELEQKADKAEKDYNQLCEDMASGKITDSE